VILAIVGIPVVFSLGFALGAYMRGAAYENQDWQVLRWNPDILGYRPLILGSYIYPDDNVVMSLEMDNETFPEDGLQYTQDDCE
jgi:hypothetical protein